MARNLESWNYSPDTNFRGGKLHIEVIADYGGQHSPDPAFTEVFNHFRRFDPKNLVEEIQQTPVNGFSTIETGFWIAQIGLHSEHPNLVIFSNTAPRGKIAWHGAKEQPLVCALLDNGIPVFAVNAGYNLSFVRDRMKGLWVVNVPNVGTQFRSRDQYPEATMAILKGDRSSVGEPVGVTLIPEVPKNKIAAIDGYGNLKTTIRLSDVPTALRTSEHVNITMNGITHEAVNALTGHATREGDLQLGVGSSGGKKDPFIEIVEIMGSARDVFRVDAPRDDLAPILIEPL